MVKLNLPSWYPLQEIEDADFTLSNYSEIESMIEQRLELHKQESEQLLRRDPMETKEEYINRVLRDRKSFTIIKMGVSLDPKLSAWFLEVEGDLFKHRFMNTDWKDKKRLLNELFPLENNEPIWLPLDDLVLYLDEDDLRQKLHIVDEDVRLSIKRSRDLVDPSLGNTKIIGIDFRYANYVVKTRKAKIYRGWVIDTIDNLSTTIKKRFESLLDQELDNYAERIETSAPGPIKRLVNKINEKLRTMVRTRKEYHLSSFEIEGTYEENMDLYPPCIQDLLTTVNNVGYIPHWERFQLGLFLKHTGMDVDEQLQFWFNKAVDNLNIKYEDFVNKAGYIIRHIYGLEGARIDYEMPSCETIQNKMYCTFRHQNIESINEKIKEYMQSLEGNKQAIKLPMAKKTSDVASQGFANHACARYLEMVNGIKTEKMFHPLQYVQMAARAQNKIKPDKDGALETNNDETSDQKENTRDNSNQSDQNDQSNKNEQIGSSDPQNLEEENIVE